MDIDDKAMQGLYDYVCSSHGQFSEHVWGKMKRDDAEMVKKTDAYFMNIRHMMHQLMTRSK